MELGCSFISACFAFPPFFTQLLQKNVAIVAGMRNIAVDWEVGWYMGINTVLGIILVIVAVTSLSVLVFWSRRTINRIGKIDGPKTARMILRQLRGGKDGQ